MKEVFLVFLSLVLFAAVPPKQPKIVSISGSPTLEIKRGGSADYPLELTILKGFHIQANPAEKYLIPLTIKMDPLAGVQAGTPLYPRGVPFRLKGSDREISTYDGTVSLKIPIQVDPTVKPGELVVKGTIRYQGCDEELCFPPVTLPVELKLRVQ
jgi:DsbC/DsbD-like thiol-disulfide interchange protein